MNRLDIIKAILAQRPKLEAQGVKHLAIYGSRARGDNRPDSDLDVLVEMRDDHFSLYDISDVRFIIGDATNIDTGVTVRSWMSQKFSHRIEDDIIEIF
jgi:hypothetical protein